MIRARSASAFSWVVRPRLTALAQIASEYALPFAADSAETSLRTTSMPARAQEYAM